MIRLLALALVAGCAFGSVISSGPEAAALVMETLVTDYQNREIRSLDHLLREGDLLGAWSYPGVFVPFDSYLVLVDDFPLANWTHPCRWVFVSPDGSMEVMRSSVPPDAYPRMQVEYTSLPDPGDGRGQYEEFLEWFEPNVQSTPENAANMYAWIISGGANMGNNHIRYYGDVQFIYNVLAHDYLLPDDHIIVCFADGLNPAPDQSGGLNSNPDFDNDGDSDIIYDATLAGVQSGFEDIKAMVGPDDHLFVFTTDHGGSGKFGLDLPPEVHLNLWSSQILDDDVFMQMLDEIDAASIHVVMEQCYSGGFMEEVIHAGAAQPRTFASAANAYEYSWAGNTFPEYDEYVYWWTGAMHGSVPPGGSYPGGALPGNPDMNGDGVVSMWEAFDRGKEWDYYAQTGQEHPQWGDTPDSCGETYWLGGLIETSISDYSHGIPHSAGLSISQNPVVSGAYVSFTTASAGMVSVEILDLCGRVVATPLSGEVESGSHSVSAGLINAPAGVYIIRLESAAGTETIRAVRL